MRQEIERIVGKSEADRTEEENDFLEYCPIRKKRQAYAEMRLQIITIMGKSEADRTEEENDLLDYWEGKINYEQERRTRQKEVKKCLVDMGELKHVCIISFHVL